MTTFFPGELADIYLYVKDADGVTFDPDSIDQLEILAPDRSVIATIETGWTNPAVGTYVYAYNMPAAYHSIIGRWKYTHATYTDYEEVKALIKGA
jgi:hypothetical protein